MVMIALDHTVLVDINGKTGGGYYKRDYCGLHWQKNPERIIPPTAYELQQRKFFEYVSHKWSYEAFQGSRKDRYSWTLYAAQHPKQNKKGETKFMSPFTAFMSVNIQRLIENRLILWHAPGIADPPPPPRLAIPTFDYENYGLFRCHIQLIFPRRMKTTIFDTPPLIDFTLHTSLYSGLYTDWEIHRAVAKRWLHSQKLELDFKNWFLPGNSSVRYHRGHWGFKTLEDDRSYGSFTPILR